MLLFTNLPNGDLKIMTDTADIMVKELFVQFSQDMAVVPNSFIPRNINTGSMSIVVANKANVPVMVNPAVEIWQISPITRKMVSRSAPAFFDSLRKQFEDGYTYQEGSANLVFGAYSVVLAKVGAELSDSDKAVALDNFDLSIAMSMEDKEQLIAYTEKYGIEVDKRKSLSKIKNWLKAQNA